MISLGRGKRRVYLFIIGGSIVEEDEEGFFLYYDLLLGMEGFFIVYIDFMDFGLYMYIFDLVLGESLYFDMDS